MHIWHLRIRASSLQVRADKINIARARMDKAAQYGHTMLAGYLMGKGARLQIVDRDGDNALHWAAFK
jgi:ankyrin repeat protein